MARVKVWAAEQEVAAVGRLEQLPVIKALGESTRLLRHSQTVFGEITHALYSCGYDLIYISGWVGV